MWRRVLATAAVTGGTLGVQASPAHAVVHEIVGRWCAGRGPLDPPGINDPARGNFAQPVNANGFVDEPVFNAALGGLLVTFNFDHPASKVQGTGEFVQIGATPDGTPIFIELIEPDPTFPAIQHCPRLAPGSAPPPPAGLRRRRARRSDRTFCRRHVGRIGDQRRH